MKCGTCGLFHPASISCDQVQASMRAGLANVLPFSLTSVVLADDDELDENDEAAWEVVGCAIPYGVELERLDWLTGATRWVFEPGSVDVEEGAQLFYGHDHMTLGMPIGLITEASELPAGHELADGTKLPAGGKLIRAKISRTTKGAEVRTLAKDGVLRRFSVGLDRPNATTVLEDAESDNPLLRWQRAPVWETSIVPRAAFHEHALIDNVLSANLKGNTMLCDKCGAPQHAGACQADVLAAYQARQTGGTGDNLAQLQGVVDSLSGTVQNLERQLQLLGDGVGAGSSAPIAVPGDSYGHFLQLVAGGDADAIAFLAFVGTDTGDLVTAEWVQETWVGPLIKMLVERRRVLNLFTTRALPAKGMTIGHGKRLSEGTIQVGKQENEGDVLPYGKLAFDAGASTPVETFGGWTDASRQVIERLEANVVESMFMALVNRYLQVTEGRARAVAMNPANASVSQLDAANDLTTPDGWIDFVLDASFRLDDAGLPLDFILTGRTMFKSLSKMKMPADVEYVLDRNFGTISVKNREGVTLELPIIPVNNPTDQNAVRAGSGDGIVTYEAPGAPFRLQDDDITNLTSAFSIYGYAAFAVEDENALIRPTTQADVDAA
jgi:hypothetical protein